MTYEKEDQGDENEFVHFEEEEELGGDPEEVIEEEGEEELVIPERPGAAATPQPSPVTRKAAPKKAAPKKAAPKKAAPKKSAAKKSQPKKKAKAAPKKAKKAAKKPEKRPPRRAPSAASSAGVNPALSHAENPRGYGPKAREDRPGLLVFFAGSSLCSWCSPCSILKSFLRENTERGESLGMSRSGAGVGIFNSAVSSSRSGTILLAA